MPGADASKLQYAQAVGRNHAPVKIHQHGRRRRVRIMARGASRALSPDVHAVAAKTSVREHAVGHVVAFIAQRVI